MSSAASLTVPAPLTRPALRPSSQSIENVVMATHRNLNIANTATMVNMAMALTVDTVERAVAVKRALTERLVMAATAATAPLLEGNSNGGGIPPSHSP
ncbi:hypothetical protein FRB95_003588 [Tulasnella sp. JGI-2019a]|nr:hypothetical protein FRB95_003588 [Tulasnella sp. JGI-2019a]